MGQTSSEITNSREEALEELSIAAGFCLLSWIESLFRKDFVARISRHKRKDCLSTYYLESYNPAEKTYRYGLNKIFDAWKNNSPKLSDKEIDVLRKLPQYFEYRNWIAHGRYWMFREANWQKKYNFDSVYIMASEVIETFDKFFCKHPMQTNIC